MSPCDLIFKLKQERDKLETAIFRFYFRVIIRQSDDWFGHKILLKTPILNILFLCRTFDDSNFTILESSWEIHEEKCYHDNFNDFFFHEKNFCSWSTIETLHILSWISVKLSREYLVHLSCIRKTKKRPLGKTECLDSTIQTRRVTRTFSCGGEGVSVSSSFWPPQIFNTPKNVPSFSIKESTPICHWRTEFSGYNVI